MRMADIRRSSASSLADSDDSYEPPRTSGPHVTLKGTNSGVAGCSNLSLSKASAQNCREAVRTGAASEIWIFGFGSLVWKPGFEYSLSVNGYITDYRRVFHQGSTDHRGTPQAPGRTVTLEHAPGCVTWGTAFRIAGSFEEQQETLKYLEWREKQYDLRVHLDVFSGASASMPVITNALTYIATSDRSANENWLGPATPEAIAQQISIARGPSGWNCEYLYNLASAMDSMGVHDRELAWLAQRVRQIRSERQIEQSATCGHALSWPTVNCKQTMACIRRHLSATNLTQAT